MHYFMKLIGSKTIDSHKNNNLNIDRDETLKMYKITIVSVRLNTFKL